MGLSGFLTLLLVSLSVSGCAALAPVSSLLGGSHGAAPGLEVHEQTSVKLAQDNFELVRTNVVGQSKGFSLLGFITIYPATLTKAVSRMYAAAEMRPGRPQTVANLIVEHSSSYWILFGIPKVEVRADIVQFVPEIKDNGKPQLNQTQKTDGIQSR